MFNFYGNSKKANLSLFRVHCITKTLTLFEPEQNDEFLYVTIYAPFTNLDETEVFMDGSDFRFYSKPYYLRSAMARRSFKASVAKRPSYGGSAALVLSQKTENI